MEQPPRLSPTIAAAVKAISRRTLADDLALVTRPRHHRDAPQGLEIVGDHLAAELARAGYGVTREKVLHDGSAVDNITGARPGPEGDKAPIVIVGAHYDAVSGSPGADDNGSGTAGLLAIARAAAAVKTRAELRMIGFSFEEEGLVGSTAYVRSLRSEEVDRIAGVIVMEMIGYRDRSPGSQDFPQGIEMFADEPLPTRGDFIGAVGLSGDPAPLDALRAARGYTPELPASFLTIPKPAALLVPDILRSDHSPFWVLGAPAVMVTDTANFRNPNYHEATDTLKTIDLAFATCVARWVLAATLILAEPVQ